MLPKNGRPETLMWGMTLVAMMTIAITTTATTTTISPKTIMQTKGNGADNRNKSGSFNENGQDMILTMAMIMETDGDTNVGRRCISQSWSRSRQLILMITKVLTTVLVTKLVTKNNPFATTIMKMKSTITKC